MTTERIDQLTTRWERLLDLGDTVADSIRRNDPKLDAKLDRLDRISRATMRAKRMTYDAREEMGSQRVSADRAHKLR
ncbi:MAG: hypothetical protein EON58_07920 [Alphaproteobacteria bacterium]|nr:MAG: hypothetical protein EON58_07920 [Alphaproteobacteria bacterium]